MALRGSFSRSLIAAARSSSAPLRSPAPVTPLPRVRPPSVAVPRIQRRRLSAALLRSPAPLGCIQSLLPLHNVVAGASLTSHLTASARAFCELSQGTSRRTCQDR